MGWAIATDGIRIHYQRHEPAAPSSRLPVVLVQGLGLSSRFWFDIPDALASDSTCPRLVIRLDNRGTGQSDKPAGLYRISRMADDVAAVLDACALERAIVVGISLGGMVAMQAAIRHPGRVAGLVLLATTPGLPHGRLPTPRALAALLYTPFIRRGTRVRWVDRILLPEHALDRAAELFARWPEAFRHDPILLPSFLSQLAAAAMHSTGFALRRVRCPAVVVAGEDDILIPPINARRIASRIPNAVLEVLPGVAHAIPALDQQVIQRALLTLEKMGA
jgi:pimeloyl-ACP methyl ester carboxylesterase